MSYQLGTYRQTRLLHAFLALALAVFALFFSTELLASESRDLVIRPGLGDPRAIFCVIIFVLSYVFVMTEESTHLRKSKPVMLGAGIIWAVIGLAAPEYGVSHEDLKHAISHDLDEYGSQFGNQPVGRQPGDSHEGAKYERDDDTDKGDPQRIQCPNDDGSAV